MDGVASVTIAILMKSTHIVACLSLLVCSLASAQTAPVAPADAAGPRQGGGQVEGRAPRAGRAGAPQSFEGAMKRVERGFESLEESALDATTKTKDLEAVLSVQAGLVAAKGMCATVKMTPAAKAKYGDDTAKYLLDMRTQLITTLIASITLEQALLAGDQKAAKDAIAKLEHQEHESHDTFKPEDEEKKGDAPKSNPPPPTTK